MSRPRRFESSAVSPVQRRSSKLKGSTRRCLQRAILESHGHPRIQEALRRQKLDGWLFFDHHERDPLAYRVLGFHPPRHVTRRWYYLIPAQASHEGWSIGSKRASSTPSGREAAVFQLAGTARRTRPAAERADARGDAVFAALRGSLRSDGGCGNCRTGARAGRRGCRVPPN